ncbi:MAG: hypothetical protein Q9227_002171 [Pyrenula ochraceoflavens]
MDAPKKKQQTLSSFFGRSNIKNTPSSDSLLNSPRSLDSDDQDIRPRKRQRRSEEKENEEVLISPEKHKLAVIDPNGQRNGSRTSKFLFSSSPLQENAQDEQADDAKSRQEQLHNRFVKKLGPPDSIAEIKKHGRASSENGENADNDESTGEDVVDEPRPATKGRKAAGNKKSGTKLTPMELQILEIKRKHMDTLLVVEVGYKFRFFGEDARTAAKELSIVCIPGKFRYDEHPSEAHLDRFASASIPVHRLHVHVKRLVAAGHKVGVVRQLETAALKAAGDNRNAPFVRKLTNLYTKGTYIDDVVATEEPSSSHGSINTSTTGFLLCLTETNAKGWGNDEKVRVGTVAVQPATGDIIYDDFEDGFMRSEIETRLLHIAPCEFLIVGGTSKASEKLIRHLSGSKTNVFGDQIRVERVEKPKTMAAESHIHISSFYADMIKKLKAENDSSAQHLLDKILNLPENTIICLSAMISHMQEYGLEHVFDLTNYFQPFSARSHMLLNANTLSSLEIYQNQTDHTAKGSLFWTLDRTQTRFGQRLLRNWVGRPLLNKAKLEERVGAVEELLNEKNSVMTERLQKTLSKCRADLEKSLIRIYYGKCTRPELLGMLQTLQGVATEFSGINPSNTGFTSTLLTSALSSLPSVLTLVTKQLEKMNLHAAKNDDKYSFFTSDAETEDISDHKLGIASVEQSLDDYRKIAAEKIGRKTPVNYATVAGIDFLIEIENSSATIKRVPASWQKISGTKKISRFHPPEVVSFIRERDQHKESLAAACDTAFRNLLAEIAQSYSDLRDAIQSLALLDCLLSLAAVASQPGYVKPNFAADTRLEIVGARHPMVEQILVEPYVPNNTNLSMSGTRAALLTGPNMGGKSSYVRSIALVSIMAQIGSFVPAESATLGLLDSVFTRMGAEDNMMKGESTFMVELGETSEILRLAGERSFVILDELGRGTSTHDGVAIAEAVLDYVVREHKGLCAFVTHYQSLARVAERFERGHLKNLHMKFHEEVLRVEGGKPTDSRITFLYEIGEGTAHRSYGLNVARLANVPDRVIDVAAEKSEEMELQMQGKKTQGIMATLGQQAGNTMDETREAQWLEDLIESIGQL